MPAAQGLVAEGVAVVHISTKANDVALRSRHSKEKLLLGSSTDFSEELLELLLNGGRGWEGACLLPTTDPMVRFVSQHVDELGDQYVTPVLDWCKMNSVVDKSRLYEVAAEVGVPVPQVLRLPQFGDAAAWSREVGFPVIIKPTETPKFFSSFGVKAFEANSESELLHYLDRVLKRNLDVVISDVIPGDPQDLKSYRSYVNRAGTIIAELCSEKVRCHPPDYGVGIVQRTIPMVPRVARYGRRLLRGLEFTGLATIEFKRDRRDGDFKLMEINPRPPMINRMLRAAGLNFAYICYLDAVGAPLQDAYHYRRDVYGIHNITDLYHLRTHARQGLAGLRAYFAPYLAPRKGLLVPPLHDPLPFLYLLKTTVSMKLNGAKDRPKAGQIAPIEA